jgi:hypothetical protein
MLKSNKKRVGIFTYMLNNYGAVLQAFALQAHLKKHNTIEVFNINFRTQQHDKQDRIFKFTNSLKSNIAMLIFTLLRYNGLRLRKKRTEIFKTKYFSLSEKYNTVEEIINTPPKMNIFLTGSDQVFDPVGIYMDVYFLNFKKGDAKKIAYAPSFGVGDISEDISKKISPFVKDFDALSCREKEGAVYLSKITGKEVPWLVDPTFLLNAEEWGKISISPNIKGKYIFIYALTGEEYLIDIARKIKEKTGYKIICQSGNTRNFFSIDKLIYGSGPAEFLGLIKNSEYVITDSFHGTVFSTIFDKPFYTFISRPNVSTRIYNLIDLLNTPDRIVTHESIKIFAYSNKTPIINKDKLNQIIQHSINFIQKNIVDEDS